jgi:uncharacterized phage protein (TIGR02218 family)
MDRLQSVTLTVETYRSGSYYVRPWNYKLSGTPDNCRIRLAFDETTQAGFFPDTPVPWDDVKRLFISLQPAAAGRGNCSLAAAAQPGASSITLNVGDSGTIGPGDRIYILGSFGVPFYTVTSPASSGAVQTVSITPAISTAGGFAIPAGSEVFVETASAEPIGESPAEVEISNISVTGPNSTLPIWTTPQPAHELRMCDGFDNAYPFTPERLVEQVYALGYRGPYVLYMGISKFHSLSWNAAEQRYVVDPAKPKLNAPTQQWLTDFFARLHARGYTIIVSVSFEILGMFMPDSWNQRDHAGNLARTGWQPPSGLIRPTSSEALEYLRDVFLAVLGLLPAGAEKHFQIGEPWWWDGAFSNHAPYIYDYDTLVLYHAQTGQYAPTPYLQSVFGEVDPVHLPYLAWCRDQLGQATSWLVSQIKAAHPSAKAYLLVFTPQIVRDDAPLLRMLNFAETAWAHPAFDVLQIEDYDKVIEGDWAFNTLTWQLATAILGYPKSKIDYFAGFNLLPSTTWIWFNTDKAIWRAFGEAPRNVFVWSREQVMRDGWLFDKQNWKVFPPLTRLAQCWKIERTDGVVMGFTSHDRPLVIDGVTYSPVSSFSASQLASDTEMSVADVELLGVLDAEEITAADLLAGVYDHAAVELFVVDWGNLELPRTIVRRGWIGTISQEGGAFRAELRGLAQRIQQPVIDSYSPECRVDLYSPPCGVSRAAFAVSASVTALTDGTLGAVPDNRTFYAAALTHPDGWFDYGEIVWTSGANAGRKGEVRAYAAGRIELWEPMAREIALGDQFTIYAGCDKRLATCRAKFNNVINFRGEPYVPGTDAMLRYPDPK